MKNTLKLKVLVSLVVISMILAIANISRAYSLDGNLTATGKLNPGEEVKVSLALSNIDMDDGVRSITIANIDYETSVFEAITTSSFAGSNGWSASYSNGKATLVNLSPMTENGTVVTLTLRVKSGITATSSTVKFENIVAASSTTTTGNIPVGTKTVTISTDAPAESGSEDPAPATQDIAPAAAIKTENTAKKENKITTTTSNQKILKAGDFSTIAISVISVAAVVVATIGIVKYAKNRDIK